MHFDNYVSPKIDYTYHARDYVKLKKVLQLFMNKMNVTLHFETYN